MAKFIIEVDDNFIREKANPESASKGVEGDNFIKCMFELIAFSALTRKLDEGKSEFHITRDTMNDDHGKEFFDRNIADLCMLGFMSDNKESENKKED